MKYLDDFSPGEKEWFWGEYIHGQRHLNDERFVGFYNVTVIADVYNEGGIGQLSIQTYAVTPDGHLFSFLEFVEKSSFATATVRTPLNGDYEDIELTFFKDALTENVRGVFGPEIVALATLTIEDKTEAAVFFQDDFLNLDMAPESLQYHMVISSMALLQNSPNSNFNND